MRFVTVRHLRGKSAEVWRRLSKERELVITSNGKPLAILSLVSEATLEESLAAIREARAGAAVSALQTRSVETGADRIPAREVEAEIAAARKRRRR